MVYLKHKNRHAPEDILNNDFESEIVQAFNKRLISIPIPYRVSSLTTV